MTTKSHALASCASCGISECPLNLEREFIHVSAPGQAWLLDEKWNEFDRYLSGLHASNPTIFVPWRGKILRNRSYSWSCMSSGKVRSAPFLTAQRSIAIRRLSSHGPRRQQVLEDFDRRYASVHSRRIPYRVTKLVVWQNMLPFLYLDKTLGGREYDVLLWRAPRHVLHQTLEAAQSRYTESKTLRDFRSSPILEDAEYRAMERATRIVTPHSQLARLYPNKTLLLKWSWPNSQTKRKRGFRLAFLGPTLGRRGAYVAREAFRKLKGSFVVIGRNLEAANFWRGLPVEERPFRPGWHDEIGLLIAPALTKFRPRLIMEALGLGITVLATESCGLPPMENLHLVDPYDAEALARKIEELNPLRTRS